MKVCITVDMEHDCPPFLSTYLGIEQGTPRLLALLAQEGVPATFFTTGDVARRYPQVVQAIVAAGHELGCHGDTHRRFSRLDRDAAREEIRDATRTLRQFYPVTSFRAPNLDFPPAYLDLLAAEGYRLDSSQGRHKAGSYFVRPAQAGGVFRVPASISPLPMRLPGPLRNAVCRLLDSPVVLFFHPWEFVDMTRAPLPLDCRIRTGDPAVRCLGETLRYFRRRGADFRRMAELPGR